MKYLIIVLVALLLTGCEKSAQEKLAEIELAKMTANAREAKHARARANLKTIGAAIVAYFADGVKTRYPEDKTEFFSKYGLLESDYEFLPEVITNKYIGASDVPAYMDRIDLIEGITYVVFEDGHVDGFSGTTKSEILESIKKENP